MTLNELVEKYKGKSVEVAGSANAKNQCVDLANLYIRDVLGLPIIEWTDAKDFPSKAGNYFDFIKNTPKGIPYQGDLVIWNSNAGGGHGHIGIFLEGDTQSFFSFDQNWSAKEKCTVEKHTYKNVSGWLHPKGGEMSDEYGDMVYKSTQHDDTVHYIWGNEKDPRQTSSKEVQQHIAGLKSRVTEFAKVEAELTNRIQQVSRLQEQLLDEEKLRKELTDKLTKPDEIINIYEGRLKVLQGQVDTISAQKGECLRKLAENDIVLTNVIVRVAKWLVNIIKTRFRGMTASIPGQK